MAFRDSWISTIARNNIVTVIAGLFVTMLGAGVEVGFITPFWGGMISAAVILGCLLLAYPDWFSKFRLFYGRMRQWLRREEERTFSVSFFVIVSAALFGLALQLLVLALVALGPGAGPSPKGELVQLSKDLSKWDIARQGRRSSLYRPSIASSGSQTREEQDAAFQQMIEESRKADSEDMADFQEKFAERIVWACRELAKQHVLPERSSQDRDLSFVAMGCDDFFRTNVTGTDLFATGLMMLAQEVSSWPPSSEIGYAVLRLAGLSFVLWIVLLVVRHTIFKYRSLVGEIQHLREEMERRKSQERYTDSY